MVKQLFKSWVTQSLIQSVVRLQKNNPFVIVAVAGSSGKTSTKHAIGQMLGQYHRIRYEEGNYNVPITVALAFFGLTFPSNNSPFAWLRIIRQAEKQSRKRYPYDVVIVELGTDGPGQLKEFSGWLQPDIGVLTSIAPEHMENFSTIHDVAKEEMVLASLCSKLVINHDLVDARYMPQRQDVYTYGLHENALYQVQDVQKKLNENQVYDCDISVTKHGQSFVQLSTILISDVQLYSVAAAVAVADLLQMPQNEIIEGAKHLTAVQGRMGMFAGLHGSRIIDDTYNASPDAMKVALRTLYDVPATRKIAVLGSMNELGALSVSAHAEIGALCDPAILHAVVTLGDDANKYLAPMAEKNGCTVIRCQDHNEAAAAVLERLQNGTLVLVKGSQNGIFAEEVVKQLLADPADVKKLVRQSEHWLKRKQMKGSDH